jgi:hypothetical protein
LRTRVVTLSRDPPPPRRLPSDAAAGEKASRSLPTHKGQNACFTEVFLILPDLEAKHLFPHSFSVRASRRLPPGDVACRGGCGRPGEMISGIGTTPPQANGQSESALRSYFRPRLPGNLKSHHCSLNSDRTGCPVFTLAARGAINSDAVRPLPSTFRRTTSQPPRFLWTARLNMAERRGRSCT